jgi:hypothetical protein
MKSQNVSADANRSALLCNLRPSIIGTGHRYVCVIAKLQKMLVTCDNQAGFDGDTIQQSAPDQFPQKPRTQSFPEQNFLSAIRLDRSCALELQWPPILIRDEQSADMAASFDFHGFHEAQSQWISFPRP